MSTLSPPMLHRLDLACHHISEVFGGRNGPYLVGSVQERTAGPGSDVDVRLILDDDVYDALMAGTPEGFASLLDMALGAYVRELTGLPVDFQVQRMTEANERHAGLQRNPLGRRKMTAWLGDARPTHVQPSPTGEQPTTRRTAMTNTTAAEMEQVREDLKREAESAVPICPEHGERPVAAGLPDHPGYSGWGRVRTLTPGRFVACLRCGDCGRVLWVDPSPAGEMKEEQP